MKICPKCHEEVEDNFEVCWKCGYSFPDEDIIPVEEKGARKLNCLRCQTPMNYVGETKFVTGVNTNVFDLLNNRECFELYVCPECGKVEFFIPR